jgi:hypothetical protein
MKLSQHDVASQCWQKIKTYYDEVIAKKRERLENPRISDAERLQLAWEIDGIKKVLAHGEPERKVTDAE